MLLAAAPARADYDDPKLDRFADEEPEADAPPVAAVAGGGAEEAALPDLSVLTGEPVRGIESSGFGWRDDPIRHRRRFHRGADYRAGRGTPVYSAADGTVIFCGRRGGYGRSIDIAHGPGLLTRYAHLQRIEVSRGDRVRADDLIGRVGSTGRATGAHLHFEVRIEGRAVDPMLAVRVGRLQRSESPEAVRAAALGLQPEAVERSVSAIDPPRDRRHGGGKDRRVRRRRPNVS